VYRITTPIPVQITAADTGLHNFNVTVSSGPGQVGGRMYLTTPSTNTGTVTINDGVNAGGIVLGKGVGVTIPVVVLDPIVDVNALGYQFSEVADVLNVLILT
jgi:hypothetical protein